MPFGGRAIGSTQNPLNGAFGRKKIPLGELVKGPRYIDKNQHFFVRNVTRNSENRRVIDQSYIVTKKC